MPPQHPPTEPTEGQLHASVAHMLDWMLLPPAFYTTFPAGGYYLNRSSSGLLKRRGLKPGMPDILCFHNGICIGIELKTTTGRLSKAQSETFAKLSAAGIHVETSCNLDGVIGWLQYYGFPLRPGTTEAFHEKIQFTDHSRLDANWTR